jgi:hypothetical protein
MTMFEVWNWDWGFCCALGFECLFYSVCDFVSVE